MKFITVIFCASLLFLSCSHKGTSGHVHTKKTHCAACEDKNAQADCDDCKTAAK